ncbi:MAG: DUF5615 family PIN-like protein [Armatimonadetes bacterium]|jgi:predicted nuclease of predicted toxin-antitoxin system|nr:DUF5615 family PIN-like protein [Armatimonadota bacterium]
MMELLADHCVGEPTIAVLREAGYRVTRLVDVTGGGDGPTLADGKVAAMAARQGRLLLTEDRDFRTRVHYTHRNHPGVILLRDTATHRDAVHRRLLRLLASPPKRLAGSIVVIDRRSARVEPAR